MRQPWGTASGSMEFSQYLNEPSYYRLSSYGSVNVRLFKGFSFNMFGEVSRTRDQLVRRRWFRGDLAMVVIGVLLLGALLITLMSWRPQGLLGTSRVEIV